jgi:hypothetical protein
MIYFHIHNVLITHRIGEEWSLELANMGTMKMIFNYTKDGLVGAKKMAGKVIASKFKICKDFATVVSCFFQIYLVQVLKL